ncbi:Pancreatic lipase-related protein 2 [Holothuria leucospilota]|uniref:Pancreatic lipase-related protein 2 n=1 Tax=Holothuria leucospilota TaxID=206669 RepID=A0A9Q0YPS6_HOLLE|nr:Pancreatic lipase-related protein 2 [Holothuria leucospilota]
MARYFDMCFTITLSTLFLLATHVTVGAKNVHYADLGDFDDDLTCNLGAPLPQKPSDIQTEFYLFTPENPTTWDNFIRWKDNASIVNSNFQGSRGTKFIIHGYNSNIKNGRFEKMKDALLSIEKLNVIMVNWKGGAKMFKRRGLLDKLVDEVAKIFPGYRQASQNTRVVGRQVGELSHKLHVLTGASYTDMHLIGHSLGAHVAGFAGEHLLKKYGHKYGRITGLDPAGPLFRSYSHLPDCLLEKSDATFVDIIHTDNFNGNEKPVGHQDFYPNGGQDQVGCWIAQCDHTRAVYFFIESITSSSSCLWLAYPCPTWDSFKHGLCRSCREQGCSRMGFHANRSAGIGKFMLGTNKDEPYCRKDSGEP